MSFGLLKHFKDLKKDGLQSVQKTHVQHLVLGHDLAAVLKLLEVKARFPGESVKLISTRLTDRQAIIENHDLGVSLLRSPEAVESVNRKYFNARIHGQKEAPAFYKDGKFHDFGGRAKPMEVQKGEEFFLTPGHRLDVSSLFSQEDWENLDAILRDHQEVRIFESIEKTAPQDLVDKAEWLLTFKDFSQVTTENLYLSMSPLKFLNLLSNKEKLTPELVDLCSAVSVQAAISVSWFLDKEVHPTEQTLFVPQSMTHEWGHFIVEFEAFDHQKNLQPCHVLFLIHDEEPQSEDLAAKIKLMKRVVERVFPDIEKHITKEYIRFDDEWSVTGLKEEVLEQVGFDYPSLKFVTRPTLTH